MLKVILIIKTAMEYAVCGCACGWFRGALGQGGLQVGGSGLAEAPLAMECWVWGESLPRTPGLVRRDAVTSTSTRGHPSLPLVEMG